MHILNYQYNYPICASGLGVPAVVHKIACNWERVGIKSTLFKLLRVKFFDDYRVLERKLRAQGFLRKEMRICAVFGWGLFHERPGKYRAR